MVSNLYGFDFMTTVTTFRDGIKIHEITSEAVAAEGSSQLEAQGRAAWLWLHENARGDSLTTERLAGEFLPMIPAYGCQCKREWQEILQKNPLPETGQYVWSVDRHNEINVKLGKAMWNASPI